jgi:hypothetical protein
MEPSFYLDNVGKPRIYLIEYLRIITKREMGI